MPGQGPLSQAEVIAELMASLKHYDPEAAILFGSWARGEQDEYSDIDLVVIKQTQERFFDRSAALYAAGLPSRAMDVFVYTPEEFRQMWEQGNPFIEGIVEEGIVIHRRPGAGPGLEELAPREVRGMKRDPKETAGFWLEQAEQDLATARELSEIGRHALACFEAQQAAEKALKAYLYRRGERVVLGHSVLELCERCESYDATFTAIKRRAAKLDRFYAQTRYPNALPGGVPALAFDEEDSGPAIATAAQVIDTVKQQMEGLDGTHH